MARIRTIKPEFFRHEGLFEAEMEAGLPLRVAFAGLWTACDRDGRFKWLPRRLKLDCLPYDDVDFSHVLDALESRGFIVRYRVTGKEYGFVPSWQDHQCVNNKERASELPDPNENILLGVTGTRDERVDDIRKGKEGNGREREITRALNANGRTGFAAEFEDEFWPAWKMNQVGEGAARKAFVQARSKASLEDIVDGAKRYQATKPSWREWASPAKWLDGEHWKDKPAKPDDKPAPQPSDRKTEWVLCDSTLWKHVARQYGFANDGKMPPTTAGDGGMGWRFDADLVRRARLDVPAEITKFRKSRTAA